MESKKYKLSEKGLLFIKKYALKKLGLSIPLDDDSLEAISKYAMDCELNTIDDNGNDRPVDECEEKDLLATSFGDEMSLHCDDEIDFIDLNSRLFKR